MDTRIGANPKDIRDVIAVFGFSKCQENTNDRVTGRAGGTQKRADTMYSVKETARKIVCPTESDEMNMKRITRYLKGVPSAKCMTRTHHIPAVRERVHRHRLGRSAHDLQAHERWSCAVGKCDPFCMVTCTTVSELVFRRSITVCLDYWNCMGW